MYKTSVARSCLCLLVVVGRTVQGRMVAVVLMVVRGDKSSVLICTSPYKAPNLG